MTTIRPATFDDAAGIARVHVETWRAAYRGIVADDLLDSMSEIDRAARWSEILRQPEQATFVAAAERHGIVGFANGGPERPGRDDFRGELYAIYILPQWHRQGIGERLVSAFACWLRDAGLDSMLVWVLADNPFRRFYENLGGRLVAEQEIEIGEQKLSEVAYGWDDVRGLTEAG